MGAATTASETIGVIAGVGAGASGKRGDSKQGARKSQRPNLAKNTGGDGCWGGVSSERVSQIRRMTRGENESDLMIYIIKEWIRVQDYRSLRMNHNLRMPKSTNEPTHQSCLILEWIKTSE